MGQNEVGGLRPEVRAQPRDPPHIFVERPREAAIAVLGQLDLRSGAVLDLEVAELLAHEQLLELRVLLQVVLLVPEPRQVERRHGDVDVAALEQLLHVPVEEREHEGADVRAVHVGVRHDDDPVVAELRDVELVADARADHLHEQLDLGVGEHLVDPVLLRVDDLPAQRQDRLVRLVARLLGCAAGGVPLDDEHLGKLRVAHLAVGELLRDLAAEGALAARQVTGLARGLAGARRGDRLLDDLLRVLRVLLEELGQLCVDGLLDEAAHPRVAELRLRLALELRHLKLHGDDRGEALAHVVALEVVFLLLEQLELARNAVQRPRQRRVEAREVRAALVRVDVVGKGVDRVLVRGVPLHRDLDVAFLTFGLEVGDPLVDRILRRVHVRDEIPDPAFVVELDVLAAGALVGEADPQPARQERGLAQALAERLVRPVDLLEDLGVRQERDRRAGVRRLAGDLEARRRLAARELLAVELAVAPDLGGQPLGECVHDGDADAVEAARDLVRSIVAAELAAGVQLRQHHRQRGDPSLICHRVDGDAGAVVADRDRVVRMDGHVDRVRAARKGLVDRVVDRLVDEMMEPARTRRADVHARPQPDRLEAFEDGDVFCSIGTFRHEKSPASAAFPG